MLANVVRPHVQNNPSALAVISIALGAATLVAIAGAGVVMYRLMQK